MNKFIKYQRQIKALEGEAIYECPSTISTTRTQCHLFLTEHVKSVSTAGKTIFKVPFSSNAMTQRSFTINCDWSNLVSVIINFNQNG